ncbi:hypothetical protein FACS1894211_01840 [Clostridia bacterium]|nr:hypothetical protein FACS1894211_01840 [Clostridia bacterium]
MENDKNAQLKILIKRMQRGDTAALEEIMLLTNKDLYLLSYGYLKDRMLAEDVVMEVFAQLIEKAKTIKDDRNLNGYLHAMVIHRSIDTIRKRRREVSVEAEDLEKIVSDGNQFEQVRVRQSLSELDDAERVVLLLWHYGYTLREITKKTGSTINKIRLVLKKAKAKFMALYDKS